jgi:hypothetical protein
MGTLSSKWSHSQPGRPSLLKIYFTNKFNFELFKFNNQITYTDSGCPIFLGIFDMADNSFGLAKLILNLALSAGSSKQGKAWRASVGWNWVVAIHL